MLRAQLDSTALADHKIRRFDFSAIEQRDGEAFAPGAELLHEVEGEGRAVGPVHMEEADEGIEPGGGEGERSRPRAATAASSGCGE